VSSVRGTFASVLREVRSFEAPELGVTHRKIELRSPGLRIGTECNTHIASDFALVERASPFLEHTRRPQLLVLLDGVARLDEQGHRLWYESGTVAVSDGGLGGLDAIAGDCSRWIVLSWDPELFAAPIHGRAQLAPIGPRDLARLERLSRTLAGPESTAAAVEMIDVLRSFGVGFEPVSAGDLAEAARPAEEEQRLHEVIAQQLTQLDSSPAIVDLIDELGFGERQLHRRIAKLATRYNLPWTNWRSALHHARMLHAIRLIGVPGATTEQVARLAGFRAPTALCHAFADAGLPSPGVLARAARREVLAGWAELAPSRAG
jgi:hypothetical protein